MEFWNRLPDAAVRVSNKPSQTIVKGQAMSHPKKKYPPLNKMDECEKDMGLTKEQIQNAVDVPEVGGPPTCSEYIECFYRDGKAALDEKGKCRGCGIHNTTLKYNAQIEKDSTATEMIPESTGPPTINEMLSMIMLNQLTLLDYISYGKECAAPFQILKNSVIMGQKIEAMKESTDLLLTRMEQ